MIRAAALAVIGIVTASAAAADPWTPDGSDRSYADEVFWGRWEDRDPPRSAVPTGQLPPPGLCRVWRAGLSAGRQARPTACDHAHAVAAKDPRASVLHDDGRLRRSYQFSQDAGQGESGTRCHLDDPRAACVIDAIARTSELGDIAP